MPNTLFSSPRVCPTGDGDELTGEADELTGDADGRTGGADELTGEADELTGGVDELTGGADELTGDVDQLTGGADELTGGTDELTGGTDELTGEADQWTGGVDELTGDADELTGGADQWTGGADQWTGDADQWTDDAVLRVIRMVEQTGGSHDSMQRDDVLPSRRLAGRILTVQSCLLPPRFVDSAWERGRPARRRAGCCQEQRAGRPRSQGGAGATLSPSTPAHSCSNSPRVSSGRTTHSQGRRRLSHSSRSSTATHE
jgi:X-X-X-Leu-X-X-Gly heptad repeat protein